MNKTVFGFWVYLMTDCVLFASLFITFAVLRSGAGGGGSAELFSLPYVLVETLLLLTSSFTCGLMMLAMARSRSKQAIAWLLVTLALGAAFLGMEIAEFAKLVQEGHSWRENGFMSGFFTLVGTHGLHILSGLIWGVVMIVQVLRRGLVPPVVQRLTMFSLFWHLLDIVWIFIFTIVYLLGAI